MRTKNEPTNEHAKQNGRRNFNLGNGRRGRTNKKATDKYLPRSTNFKDEQVLTLLANDRVLIGIDPITFRTIHFFEQQLRKNYHHRGMCSILQKQTHNIHMQF